MAEATSSKASSSSSSGAKDRAKVIAERDYDACPNCQAGVLRVTVYDPEAVHEQLQGHTTVPFTPSGGAVQRHCFNCNYHESTPLEAPEAEA